MIFKIIFIVISFSFLLTTSNAKAKQSYDAKGFAYIYNDLDFKKKLYLGNLIMMYLLFLILKLSLAQKL